MAVVLLWKKKKKKKQIHEAICAVEALVHSDPSGGPQAVQMWQAFSRS